MWAEFHSMYKMYCVTNLKKAPSPLKTTTVRKDPLITAQLHVI